MTLPAIVHEPEWMRPQFVPEPGAAARRREQREATRKAQRRAMLGAVGRTLGAVCLSALVSFGAWQAWRWATRAPLFAIQDIHFSGLVHAGEGDLLRRSGLSLGQNLFRADLARATHGIEAHPWVVSARLERRLPGTVVATVAEHRAAALVQLGTLYVLDDEARLFKRAAPDDHLDLPLVTGLSRDSFDAHSEEGRLRLFTVLQALDAWRAEGLLVQALSELRFDDDAGLTVFARDGASVQEIRLGARDFAPKLHRLAQVRAALARRGERAVRIDLDNEARPEWVAAQLTSQDSQH